MSNEKQYLNKIEAELKQLAAQVRDLSEANSMELLHQLADIIDQAVEYEQHCRDQYNVGARFSVITNQLKELHTACQTSLAAVCTEDHNDGEGDAHKINEDEVEIFIHLFNAQGSKVKSWRPLLNASALMDHSINRPIYANKKYVEELIRSKEIPEQHAYVRAIIKQQDVLMSEQDSILKDKLGNPIIRIKHGALKPPCIQEFYHQGKIYLRDQEGNYELQVPYSGS